MTKWWIVAACVGLTLWALDIKIDPIFFSTAVLFIAAYVIAVNMDRQHDEQMRRMQDLEEYLRSIESRLP